jgi:hypothetical protein
MESSPDSLTHVRICICHRKADEESSDFHILLSCKGRESDNFSTRAACGILLIGLTAFEAIEGFPLDTVPEGFSNYVMVDTESQKIYFTGDAERVKPIVSMALATLASQIGVETDPMPRHEIIGFISEAIRSLGGIDLESMVNARGGQA